MVEKSNARKRHSDAVLVASHYHMVVANRATCLGYELHAALMGTLNIVAEGEEGIRTKGYLRVLGNPAFFSSKVSTSGCLVKNCCQAPSRSTSSCSSSEM